MSRTVIKLGSATVADEGGELRLDVLEHVCAVAARLRADGGEVVIVTSGAIARGARLMSLAARPRAIEELQAASAVGQGGLFNVYDSLLAAHGVRSAQVLLTFFDISARTHYLNARGTLRKLLEWGVVPVVNENDTTATDEISFGDNDFLAAQVAVLIDATRLVLLTDTDGLYTADPREDAGAELVREVSDFGSLEALQITQRTGILGSGGMRSKVVAADMATAAGITTWICNGRREGALERVLAGEQEGTLFHPRRLRHSSFKLWLKFAKPSRGTILVDAGAARALRDGAASLLPVGVAEVRGEFDAGDAVDIAQGAAIIGKGISGYSAADLRRAQGLKSAQVRERLPGLSEEAVHRDYFVLA
ncbi:MAG: glutamate 5-kinase [Solirubrobacteraceae bacterium]